MDFAQYMLDNEQRDGVRFSFNLWPSTKAETAKLVVPIAAGFTPLKHRPDLPPTHYEPVYCSRQSCRAILNPFCYVDYKAKIWTCVFCMQRNGLPTTYHGMDEQNRVAELYPQLTTMEYTPQTIPSSPVNFMFVLDTCLPVEEMGALVGAVENTVDRLPPNANVGVITFGRVVQIHVISSDSMAVSYVFKGSNEVQAKSLQDFLGLHNQLVTSKNPAESSLNQARYIVPLSECREPLRDLLKRIRSDAWPEIQGKRPIRATGAAISIAISLLEVLYPNCPGRIMTFIGGTCTEGPGKVVDDDLKFPIRSHHDIQQDNSKYMRKAIKFYEALANRAASDGQIVDIFACCLDQTGLAEMKFLCNYTGGAMVIADSFQTSLFNDSLKKVFDKLDNSDEYDMGMNGNVEVKTSRELRVGGCIGLCVSLGQKKANVSDQEIGIGGTNTWKMCSMTSNSTYIFFFDVATTQSTGTDSTQGYIQFITKYQKPSGITKIRVTTVWRSFIDTSNSSIQQVGGAFDQDAAAVIVSRIAVYRCDAEDATPSDVLRWLDKMLIRVCQRFGMYTKDNPLSFQLGDNFGMFPQYMFHLRRSQFLQVFNNSPDETSFYRHCLFRETIPSSIIMILPLLYAYSMKGNEPVMLDSRSIIPDRILLMDDFFHLVIYHGEHIDQWRKAGYQNDPNYQAFAELLQAPINDAGDILLQRFPMPRYVVTEANGSQSRFLLCKVNPSQTHNSMWNQEGGAPVLTDDVNLQVFFDHLKKLSVSSNT